MAASESIAPAIQTKLNLLWKQANVSFDKNEFSEALKILVALEKRVPALSADPIFLKDISNLKGMALVRLGDLAQAEKSFLQSLAIAQQIGEPKFIYNRYDNLVALYLSLSEKQKAIGFLQLSIDLKETTGNERDLGRGFLQLADLHFTMGNFAAGREALAKARGLLIRHNQKEFYPVLYHVEAMQLKREENYSAAVKSYSLAIKYARKFNDLMRVSRAYYNSGEIFLLINNPGKAEACFRKALEIAVDKKMKTDELAANCQLAQIALSKGDFSQCRYLLEQVRQQASEFGNHTVHRDLAELTARLLEAEGNYKQAVPAYKKYIDHYRKFYDNELSRTVLDLQAKYESEKKERELQQAKLQQTESELKALRAQIDPHFIFNALNTIRSEVLEGNTEKVDEYLVRFSRLLRLILNSTRHPRLPLSEITELLHLYIQIEQTRQSHRFTYAIKTARGIDDKRLMVPGLLLQPLVENAIVHGLYHKRDGKKGKLLISFAKKDGALQVKISDNGIGRQKSATLRKPGHQSHALDIIRETLALTAGGKTPADRLLIKDKRDKNGKPAGTDVIILLPLS